MAQGTDGGIKLHLGCGRTILPGWTNLDSCPLPGVDLVVDLEGCEPGRIPLPDSSVKEFLASHVLEHIRAPLPLMQELYRVAKPGAKLVVRVPYGSSDVAWEDPTHVRPYFLDSFGYFGQPYYWRADYGYRGDWRVELLELVLPDTPLRNATVPDIAQAVRTQRNVVDEMVAKLCAVKPARPPSRDLQQIPPVRYLFQTAQTPLATSSGRIPLFDHLEIETSSRCNRSCAACIRNSHPDREALRPWFEDALLPTEAIERIFREARDLGFSGPVCLQHYNEPVLDERLAELGRKAKLLGFSYVFTCTNGDLVTEAKAAELDGCFDEILVALYMAEPVKSRREAWLRSLFRQTLLTFTGGGFIPTHFSPLYDVAALAAQHRALPCREPLRRMIVNHRGDMLLCCDDVIGHFELGNIRDHSLEELWFGERHQSLVRALGEPGGRSAHPHCQSCPRA
jgi:radical SAM protein with 4Fe4S-binding SPASM domain